MPQEATASLACHVPVSILMNGHMFVCEKERVREREREREREKERKKERKTSSSGSIVCIVHFSLEVQMMQYLMTWNDEWSFACFFGEMYLNSIRFTRTFSFVLLLDKWVRHFLFCQFFSMSTWHIHRDIEKKSIACIIMWHVSFSSYFSLFFFLFTLITLRLENFFLRLMKEKWWTDGSCMVTTATTTTQE